MTTFPSTGERFVLVEGPPNGIALEATTVYTMMTLRDRGLVPHSTIYDSMHGLAVSQSCMCGFGVCVGPLGQHDRTSRTSDRAATIEALCLSGRRSIIRGGPPRRTI